MGMLVGANSRNLEQLSSFLSILSLTRPNFEFRNCRNFRKPSEAIELVNRCIRHLVRYDLTYNDLGEAVNFFNIVQFADISFVTTNYDLVLELAAHKHGSALRAADEIANASQTKPIHSETNRLYAVPSHVPQCRIFKLHGSVNWFTDNGKLIVADNLEACGDSRNRTVNYSGIYPQSAKCLIVPPTVLKPQFDFLQDQWTGASAAISKAEQVWFLGCSFPESDSFMRYFLASALSDNAAINRLLVVDPDRSVQERARSIFRGPALDSVFAFLPVKWNDFNRETVAKGSMKDVLTAQMIRILELQLASDQILRGDFKHWAGQA